MHILFVLDYFPPYIGGIETLFDDVTNFCIDQGYSVTVLTSCHDDTLPPIEKRKGVLIYRVGSNRLTIFFAALWWGLRHRTIMKSVDHIHTSTFTASLAAWLLSKIYKKPCTITVHEIYDMLWYHLKGNRAIMYLGFEKLLFNLPWFQIVAVSTFTKEMIQRLHGVLDSQVSVISNQINTSFWSRDQVAVTDVEHLKKEYNLTDSTVGLFVGRLGYEKGLPYLIEAIQSVVEVLPDFKLVIIAPKNPNLYTASIQKLIKITKNHIVDNNLDQYVTWIDPVASDESLRLWMAATDIGIVPSMSEGFCYTAVQMQAMGLPLVVSRVGALPEVLDAQHMFVGYGKIKEISSAILRIVKNIGSHTAVLSIMKDINYQKYCDVFSQKKTYYPVR